MLILENCNSGTCVRDSKDGGNGALLTRRDRKKLSYCPPAGRRKHLRLPLSGVALAKS